MITSYRLRYTLALAGLAGVFAAIAHAQSDPAVVDKIVSEGKDRSQVMTILKDLSKIGPRLTGSTKLTKAEDWCMKKFKEWGLKNVAREQWGEIPVGWERGNRQVARMVSPERLDFEFTWSAWSEGTKGLTKGKAIKMPGTVEEVTGNASKFKGAWIMSPRVARGGGGGSQPPTQPPALTPEQRDAINKALLDAGVAGFVTHSANDLVVTSGSWANKTFESHPMDVRVTIRKSDYDKVVAHIDAGKEPVLEFDLESKWIKGPIPQYNIVAEIPGTEKPDEVVIVSGHLDTWDGPGSVGALDNGTGVSTAMEAARILMKVGAKPKRTIRFILWGGEEQGLHGSRAYVAKHKDKLDKISAVLVDDGGTNYHGGYVCIEPMKAMLEEAIQPTVRAFPELPMKIDVRETMPRGGGSDHAPFNGAGVPGFFTMETGRSDYNYVHHTQHDKVEMAIPEYLVQSATNHAVVSFYLANAPTMLPRAPKPPTTK